MPKKLPKTKLERKIVSVKKPQSFLALPDSTRYQIYLFKNAVLKYKKDVIRDFKKKTKYLKATYNKDYLYLQILNIKEYLISIKSDFAEKLSSAPQILKTKLIQEAVQFKQNILAENQKEVAIVIFKNAKTPFTFKPAFALQGALVFTAFLFVAITVATVIFPPKQLDPTRLIKTATVKQTSAVVAGQKEKVQWTAIIKKSDITNNKYLLQLPKNAKNIKVSTISKQQAIAIANAEAPRPNLATADRVQLAKLNTNTFSKISNVLFADLEEAATNVVEQIAEQISPSEPTIVDLSAEALAPSNDGVKVGATSEVLQSSAEEEKETKEKKETKEEVKEDKKEEKKQEKQEEKEDKKEEESVTPDVPQTQDQSGEASEVRPPENLSAGSEEVGPQANLSEDYVAVTYETPAPRITEKETSTGKIVTVSDPTETTTATDIGSGDQNTNIASGDQNSTPSTDYSLQTTNSSVLTNVLAFTTIPEIYKVGQERAIKIKWKNENGQNMPFKAYDLDNNGKLDYIEWTVPHLSDQIFEIILISRAWHLDSNQEILEDVFDAVKTKDNVFSTIPANNYIRATFEQVLDNTRDITIFAQSMGSMAVEVYPVYTDENGNQTQGEKLETVSDGANPDFSSIDSYKKYRILLTNLAQPTDVFDLKVIGGSDLPNPAVEFDNIFDPVTDRYWVGGTGNWSDDDNHWALTSGGAAGNGNVPVNGDNVIFDASSGTGTVTIDTASVSMLNVTESSANITIATSTNGLTITGDLYLAKTISGATAVTVSGSDNAIFGANSATISAPLALGANTEVYVGSGNTFTVSGVISNAGNLAKTGAGQLTLSGANTFTGGLTIKAGTVALTTSTSAGGGSGTGTITIGDTSGSTAATLKGDGRTFANPIVLATGTTGTLTIQPSATSCIFSGGVTGTNNLTLNGSSSYTLTLSTATVNNAGTITNVNAGTGTITISSVIGTNVTGVIQNSATSILVLSGANTWTSGLTIKSGTVYASTSTQALGNVAGGGTNGTVILGDSSGTASATLSGISTVSFPNPITVASGSSGTKTIRNDNNQPTFSGLITLADNLTITGDSSGGNGINITGGTAGTGNLILYLTRAGFITVATGSINHTGTITNSGTGSNAPTISAVIGTNVTGITQNSATSQLTLSGANTYTGTTTVSAGTLQAGVASVAGVSGAFGNNSDVTMADVASAVLNITGYNTQIGSLTGGGSTGGNVTLGAATLTIGGTTSPSAYAGVISGTGGLTKSGSGTLTLNTTNTYTGDTTINGGTVLVGADVASATNGPLGNSSNAIIIGDTSGSADAYLLTNGAFTIGRDITVRSGSSGIAYLGSNSTDISYFSGNIALSKDVTLTATTGSTATFQTGVISGDFSVTKTGSGIATLTGANTYTGTTTISQGTLNANKIVVASSNSSLGNASSAVVLGAAATSGTLYSTQGTISYTRGFTVNAGGGEVDTSTGTLTVATGGITANGPLTVGRTGTMTISAIIADGATPGSLIMVGTGTLTLSGANTFTSGLTIKAGTVSLTTSTAAAGEGTITLGDTTGSTAATLKGDGRTFANPIVLATGTTGTLTISTTGNTTFSGAISGTNNLTTTTAGSNTLALSNASINNTGTITNAGAGTGAVTISGIIGTNVTGVIQNSATSQLTLSGANTFTSGLTIKAGTVLGQTSTQAFGDVTGGGTNGTITLGDSSGSAAAALQGYSNLTFANPITVASGSSGTLQIKNTSSTYNFTFSGAITLNNNLAIDISGTSNITLSGIIGGDGAITYSNTSTGILYLSGANTFGGGLTIKSGRVVGQTSNKAFGGDGTGTIILGDSSGSADATLQGYSDLTFANPITVASGSSGIKYITQSSISNTFTFSGAITLSDNLTVISTGSVAMTLSGGIGGTGNLILTNNSSGNITLSTTSVNHTGTITHTGSSSGAATISAVIGTNVTGITQNSATSALTLSGVNTYTGPLTNSAGTLNITQDATYSTVTIAGDSTTNITAGKIITLTDLVSTGTAGHLAIWKSATAAAHTLTTASAQISVDYMNLTYSQPTQANVWYAGANSTDGGNNGNWVFTVPDATAPTLATGVNPATITYDNTSTTVDIADVGTCTDAGAGMHATLPYQVSYSDAGTSADADCSNNSYTITTAWGTNHNASFTGTDGHYYCIKLECQDAMSTPNSTAYYSANNILYDITSPTVTGITSVAGDTSATYYDTTDNSSTAVVYTTDTDASACKWDTSNTTYDLMANTCSSTTNCTLNLSGDGAKTVYLRCIDTAGNKASSSYTLNYTIDATAPTTSDDFTSDDTWVSANQTITLTPTDATSGVSWTKYCTSSNSCDPASGTAYTVPVEISTEGTSYFRYASQDNAGNTQTTVNRTIKIDKTNPTTIATATSGGASYTFGNTASASVEVTLTCADGSGSGCSVKYYCTDTANTCTPTSVYSTPVTVSTEGASYFRYSSTDFAGNAETANSSAITITTTPATVEDPSSIGGPSTSFPPFPTPTPTPPTIIEQIVDLLNPIPSTPAPEINYPPITESVPVEPQKVFQGSNIISQAQLDKINILPLPESVKELAIKFPKFAETLEKVGIQKPGDIKKLQATKLSFPGLAEASGVKSSGIAVYKFTEQQKQNMPANIAFARLGNKNIDLNINVAISSNGMPTQSIRTIENKPVYLVVKPDNPVNSINGYIVFKSADSQSAFLDFIKKLPAVLTASIMEATNLQKNTVETVEQITAKKDIVLSKFDYNDDDNDGIWTATINSPVSGKYEIKTVLNYEKTAEKEISMIMVVDPEGYIYEKTIGNKEIRISDAVVSIYWLDPDTKKYEIWPAKEFQQKNPQTTDQTGRYSFLVPAGEYYLEITSKDYSTYKGEPFQVTEGSGIHQNIELQVKNIWLRIFSIERIMLGIVIFLLLAISISLLYLIFKKNNQIK